MHYRVILTTAAAWLLGVRGYTFYHAMWLTGEDDRSEALPDERVDDLDHRATWAVGGQGVGSPRRVSHHVAGSSHVCGIDSSTRHERSERLTDLVSVAGIPDESRTQAVRVAAAIGSLRSLERSRDLSHQARHDERVVRRRTVPAARPDAERPRISAVPV